ncbi:hypothetical protein EV426DRAFT_707079 [Tirmania nivea]|nr:hypothetical protein EV426DRAFT_707079 [Tirmania nivea]
MDERTDCPSPKEKGTGFKSFLSRLGGKRLSLPQLQNLESNNGPTSATLSNQLLSPTKSITQSPSKNSHDVPPLFVAYPQAIKAAALAALTTSSDTILRRNLEQKNREKKGGSRLAQRARSYSRVEMEWTQKMFLLVPSMLLQYSGEGVVDRMPEKILQLTATSVAFASDIIPGRPYVLQVSQNANADGSPIMEDNRRGKIKLPWKNSTKHVAVSFLLIFDTAKEMDSWMGCIRVEAAKLAGTYIEEKEEEPERVPRALSRRISIRRDREEDDIFDLDTSHRFSRYSRNSRASLDAGTSVTTAVSSEQVTLNHLRGSRSYMSMSSNGRGTVHGTSPETSPERPSGQAESTRRRSGVHGAPSYSRSSMELRSNEPASSRRSIERTPIRVPSPCSSSFYASIRVPVPTTGWKLQIPPPSSPISKRNSVYSNNSAEGTGTRPAVRRSSATCAKPQFRPEFTVNRRSYSSTYVRARPTSMVDSRPSLEVPRSISTLPHSNSSEPRNLQRRSMTSLGTRPDYGIGPPAFPPPQIPLPELPPEGYSVLSSRRKSIHQGTADKRGVSNGSAQTLGISVPILGNRRSFQAFRKPGNM